MWKKQINCKINSKLRESTNSEFIFHSYLSPHNFPLYPLHLCECFYGKSCNCEWKLCREHASITHISLFQLLTRNCRCKAHRHGLATIKQDLEMSNTFTMSTDKHISRLDGNYSPAVVLSLLDALQRRYHYFSARKTSCSCITV